MWLVTSLEDSVPGNFGIGYISKLIDIAPWARRRSADRWMRWARDDGPSSVSTTSNSIHVHLFNFALCVKGNRVEKTDIVSNISRPLRKVCSSVSAQSPVP